jgi:hypothetical protein
MQYMYNYKFDWSFLAISQDLNIFSPKEGIALAHAQ